MRVRAGLRVWAGAVAVTAAAAGCAAQDGVQEGATEAQASPSPSSAAARAWPVQVTSAVEVTYHLASREQRMDTPAYVAYEIGVAVAEPTTDPGPCALSAAAGTGIAPITLTLTNTQDEDGPEGVRQRHRIPYLEATPVGEGVGPLLWVDGGECVEELDEHLTTWDYPRQMITVQGYLAGVPLQDPAGVGLEVATASPSWEIVDGHAEPLPVVL